MSHHRYASMMEATDALLEDAQVDIRKLIREQLTRELREVGADTAIRFEERPYNRLVAIRRTWWEWLLRREPRTHVESGIRFLAWGDRP